MNGQLDDPLLSPAAHCHVYLHLWIYCILSVVWWQINAMMINHFTYLLTSSSTSDSAQTEMEDSGISLDWTRDYWAG